MLDDYWTYYGTFWYLTRYYFAASYYYFPGVIVVFSLVFSLTWKLMSPYVRITPALGIVLNAIPVVLMVLIAFVLLFTAGEDLGNPEQPFWVRALTLIYAAGPYFFIGTLIFTVFFVEQARAIWVGALLILLIWPVIPNYVYYSYEIGCRVYDSNCGMNQ